MGKFVGGCVVLFALAVGYLVVGPGQDIASLFNAYRAEPFAQKLAWLFVVLIPLVIIPSALWLSDSLLKQRKAANALELRLDGVRQGVKEAAKSQVDADAALRHLARTDPEDAIGAVQQRLTEAERVTQIQQSRNEVADLQARVDNIRDQQDRLKERLAPVVEKRRSIEQLFTELDSRQNDIERSLAEVASGDDAVALDLRLKGLGEFIRRSHENCDEIENAAKTIAGLKEDFSELRKRLDPFAAADAGVTRRIKDLSQTRDKLAADIDALLRTGDGSLAERVRKFADEKVRLDGGLGQLDTQFSKLATLRGDIDGLFANFDRILDVLAIAKSNGKANSTDARVEQLSEFIKATQARFDDLEGRMVTFGQLKAKLGDLQSRLLPLESEDGGVADVIGELADIRERLIARISHLEEGDDGDLAGRVKVFSETKKELEKRVENVTEQVSKLATMRKDIAGLFDKLNSAASDQSN
jgi:chromosome segregation ATPase